MLNHLDEESLILLFYNEPDVPAEQRVHLAECAHCRSEMTKLQDVLCIADQYEVPDPGPYFEQRLWANLAPAIAPRGNRFSFLRVCIPVLTMAALVFGAFYLGRMTRPSSETPLAGLSAKARERILVISLADHLERAGMLLTDVENDGDFDRDRAKDLVSEGRLMRKALQQIGGNSNQPLLDDVERVLLEVANSPRDLNTATLSELRQRIGSQSLLFKVRVAETNLRAKGTKL